MRLNPDVKLRGDRNECPTCGELFNSSAAFVKHRRDHACLSVAEMLAKGMDRNQAGFWIGSKRLQTARFHFPQA